MKKFDFWKFTENKWYSLFLTVGWVAIFIFDLVYAFSKGLSSLSEIVKLLLTIFVCFIFTFSTIDCFRKGKFRNEQT